LASLAEVLRTHHDVILRTWTEEARRSASARGLDEPALTDVFPAYFEALAEAGASLGQFTGKRRECVEEHVSSRLRHGFQLAEVVEEFAILGRCVTRVWNRGSLTEAPPTAEVESFFEELNRTSVAVTDIFTRHMMEDEQTEKRYIGLIQAIANEALQADRPAFRERLNDVLELIAGAMAASSAALLLYNAETGQVELVAAAGTGSVEIERHVSSLHLSTLAGQIASRHVPTEVQDVATTELELNDQLRRSGLHSLLGVRLPPLHRLIGILFVGLREAHSFSPREKGRLELFGAHLTVHLENAKLYADLRDNVGRLESERGLRDQFVSVLAHDLRGPLSSAKISAEILVRMPERLDVRRELGATIVRNVDRADRMIRDLLDTNRIRAGQAMPLRIGPCDLSALARDVQEELASRLGDRLVLNAEEHVPGFWSADEIRRALWNLVTNAGKYGAADRPITIEVRKTAQGARVSVHNWGTPIAAEDQKRLFREFSRTHAAQIGGQKGWGLGLTLVRGCATAHGGNVLLESSESSGTTFILELPRDSRQFQPRA
jgi:signal transduction histidine kinase